MIEYSLVAAFVAVAASALLPPAIIPTIHSIFRKFLDLIAKAY